MAEDTEAPAAFKLTDEGPPSKLFLGLEFDLLLRDDEALFYVSKVVAVC